MATLTLSPTTWSASAAASNQTITVTSNTTWNTPTSNVNWLTISNITPANRNGNGSFRINATANTGAQRTGTITVIGGGHTRTVAVTQAAANVQPVIPTVTLNSISNITLGQTVTVSGSATNPTWRMAALVQGPGLPDGGQWIGEVFSNSYSRTFTPPQTGVYTITLFARSFPENDPRTGQGSAQRSFTVSAPAGGQWTWPVPASQRITQRFIAGTHLGIDIGGSTAGVAGDSIVAFANGVVVLAEQVGGYGEVIYIDHTNINGFNRLQTRYGHLQRGSFTVRRDDLVNRGNHIARMGNTVAPGFAPVEVHLHFETRTIHRDSSIINNNSTAIDPLANFFPTMRASIVIPEASEAMYRNNIAAGFHHNESMEIVVESAVYLLPNGNTTNLTLGNLSIFSRDEVIAFGVTAANIQAIINDVGLELVLEHLNDLGLEHLGLTIGQDGVVRYSR